MNRIGTGGSALQARLRICLLRREHIAERVAIYSDPRVMSNLAHTGVMTPPDVMTRAHEDWLDEGFDERLMYRVSLPTDELIGFTWLTELDWVNQTCELSIAILPEHRGRWGLFVLLQMYDFLHNSLNMEVVVNQVLSVNEMLLRPEVRAGRAEVVSPDDCFTAGSLRTNYRWTQDRTEHENFTLRAIERRERIKAKIAAQTEGQS
jgi:hypothetical protein